MEEDICIGHVEHMGHMRNAYKISGACFLVYLMTQMCRL